MSQINVYLILLIFKLWETGDLTLWSLWSLTLWSSVVLRTGRCFAR